MALPLQYAADMSAKRPSSDAKAQPDDGLAVQRAYLGVARHLARFDRSAYGLWPVPAETPLEGPARHLAAALATRGLGVGLVAPRAGWRKGVSPNDPFLSRSPAGDDIDLLTPAWPPGANPHVVIERTLALARDRYRCVLLDLSGLDILGVDQSAVVPGLDLVLFVAAGRTNEFTLARVRRRLPPERITGVVLGEAAPIGSAGEEETVTSSKSHQL